MTIYIACVAFLVLVAFVSGMFESFLVEQCTQCNRGGHITAICHRYSGAVRSPGIVRFRLGVIHRHHLCTDCFHELFERIFLSAKKELVG